MSEFHKIIKNIPEDHLKSYLGMVMKRLEDHDPGSNEKLYELFMEVNKYDNYLTKDEYEIIIKDFVNQYGTVDNFNCQELERYLVSLGKKVHHEPFFNKFVLFALMNYLWSRHTKFIEELSSTGRYNKQMICYTMALDMLTPSKKGWVRDMFEL